MSILSDKFLENILILVIGIAVLAVGAQMFVTGTFVAFQAFPNYLLMLLLLIVGLLLMGFGIAVLLRLLERLGMRIRE